LAGKMPGAAGVDAARAGVERPPAVTAAKSARTATRIVPRLNLDTRVNPYLHFPVS